MQTIPLDKDSKYFNLANYIPIVGFITVMTVGVIACALVILAAIWLLVQAAALILASTVVTLSSIGATYNASSPLIQTFVWIIVAYGLYRVYRKRVQA